MESSNPKDEAQKFRDFVNKKRFGASFKSSADCKRDDTCTNCGHNNNTSSNGASNSWFSDLLKQKVTEKVTFTTKVDSTNGPITIGSSCSGQGACGGNHGTFFTELKVGFHKEPKENQVVINCQQLVLGFNDMDTSRELLQTLNSGQMFSCEKIISGDIEADNAISQQPGSSPFVINITPQSIIGQDRDAEHIKKKEDMVTTEEVAQELDKHSCQAQAEGCVWEGENGEFYITLKLMYTKVVWLDDVCCTRHMKKVILTVTVFTLLVTLLIFFVFNYFFNNNKSQN